MRVSFVAFTTQVGVLHGAGLQSGVGARVFRTGLRHSQVCCEASCLRAHSIVSAKCSCVSAVWVLCRQRHLAACLCTTGQPACPLYCAAQRRLSAYLLWFRALRLRLDVCPSLLDRWVVSWCVYPQPQGVLLQA